MTDLPPETNERVAAACGLKIKVLACGVFIDQGPLPDTPWAPATDPVAALKAADAYADLRKCDVELSRERINDKGVVEILHWCKFEGVMDCRGPTREHAICRSIMKAEEARTAGQSSPG